MKNKIWALFLLFKLTTGIEAQRLGREIFLMETPMGNMKIKLYKDTPKHRKNFMKLVDKKFFDSTLFHRVINKFMIQGGDPLSKHAKPGDTLGHGNLGYTIPAEFRKKLFHQNGKLCAARENDDINPNLESDASQFYLVMGSVKTMEDMEKYKKRINKAKLAQCQRDFLKTKNGIKLNELISRFEKENKKDSLEMVKIEIEISAKKIFDKKGEYSFGKRQIETYTSIGGTPHLDSQYTVFGEVIEGIEVIDKIAGVKTDKRDRPIEDIRIKVTRIK